MSVKRKADPPGFSNQIPLRIGCGRKLPQSDFPFAVSMNVEIFPRPCTSSIPTENGGHVGDGHRTLFRRDSSQDDSCS